MKFNSIRTIAMTMVMGMCAGLHASVTERQPPAPLPEFKTPEQLAKWRADQNQKTQTSTSSQEDGVFYTGKPYLADSGSYAFKYRQYSPEMGQWTTVDPSGFPDGANNRMYARAPISGLDPNGLTFTSYSAGGSASGSLAGTFFGGAILYQDNPFATTAWNLPGNASGWIIQNVTLSQTITKNNSTYTVNPSFTEAFQVQNGNVFSGDTFTVYGSYFSQKGWSAVTGTLTGTASYYPSYAITTDPGSWGSNITLSGGLPSVSGIATIQASNLENLEPGSATHYLKYSWVE